MKHSPSAGRPFLVGAMTLTAALAFGCDLGPGGAERSFPLYRVHRASEPPVLDGNLDDAVWSKAKTSSFFVDTMSGKRGALRAWAKLLWDDENLYLAAEVADELIVSPFQKHDDQLWQRDCVELFLDPNGDGLDYLEIQVSPLGTVFDTHYERRRRPSPYGHIDWQSLAKASVSVDGKANDHEEDRAYRIEVAIPFSTIQAGSKQASPKRGDRWRANLYVMDWTGKGQRAVSWSAPLVGDFHVPARFGMIDFTD